MLRRPQDGHDSPDAYLRQLLDQRAARSAVHQDYDSPSVYSSPFFSPRPNDLLDTRSLNDYRHPPSPPAPVEPRTRLNELAESMLDMGDDRLSDEEPDADDQDTVDADHDARLSLLGPKMRFHGRAPWEMDGGALDEEEEDSDRSSGRSRDIVKKGLGFRSSSRGTTASSRPSGESSRSQTKPKRSFEGALHALGQASMSSVSLVPTPPTRQSGLRLNFPRSGSPPSYTSSLRGPASPRSIASRSPIPSPVHSRTNDYSHFTPNKPPTLSRRATDESSASQPFYAEEMHPYANPDLVVSYAEDPATPAPRSAYNMSGVSRSDSTATVTESLASANSMSRSIGGSTLTPDTSTSSMAPSPRNRASMFHGKEISAPLPIHPTGSPLQIDPRVPSPLPGWTDRGASPTFTLISLEQARAQRSRSATAQNLSISSTSSTPFPETLSSTGGENSPTGSVASRARVRSISTGAKAKNALQSIVGGGAPPKPERRDSEPSSAVSPVSNGGAPGKTLKHKKSGFMRLFNGARGTEKDGRSSPPPVPALSDGYAAFNAHQGQQTQTGYKLTKGTSHRVPPPQISPSMEDPGSYLFDDGTRISPSSSRPIPPSLSINTTPQSRMRSASTTVDEFQTRTMPSDMAERNWHQLDLPQSAPANVTEFPALKLRPVSTLFSSHFGEHIVSSSRDSDPQPGLEPDLDSSTSPSTVVSPITPAPPHSSRSSERNSSEKAPPMATISEDQSALVQVQELQEQLGTAKKAWQRHIWDLEGQVRDLKAEVEALRAAESAGGYCGACGRGKEAVGHEHKTSGVVNRPRARTGTSARFGSAV